MSPTNVKPQLHHHREDTPLIYPGLTASSLHPLCLLVHQTSQYRRSQLTSSHHCNQELHPTTPENCQYQPHNPSLPTEPSPPLTHLIYPPTLAVIGLKSLFSSWGGTKQDTDGQDFSSFKRPVPSPLANFQNTRGEQSHPKQAETKIKVGLGIMEKGARGIIARQAGNSTRFSFGKIPANTCKENDP